MKRVQALYQLWSQDPFFDEETRAELTALADQPQEIEERFYMDLAFGTAGLRGLLGAGTNRMNRYTVVRAADGFARYLLGNGRKAREQGVVISYDSRHGSAHFAQLTAAVMIGHGLRVRLSDRLRPVPMLSFAIRKFGAIGGVMITASHNPASYNGFKAYGSDGGQLPPEAAEAVSVLMQEKGWTELPCPQETDWAGSVLFEWLGEELDCSYEAMLQQLVINREAIRRQADLKLVYTPLHGAALRPVTGILQALGFQGLHVVAEQKDPDPDFSTVAYPNPEEREALTLAIQLAEQERADLVIATDPDGDRTGLAVRRSDGEMVVLSGNQIGLLLADYILSAHQSAGTLPARAFMVTTIVSTKLMRRIAAYYDITLFECLTGFKFIAELIREHDEEGDMSFLFGFEESFGYLAGTDVRDKDAVVTSMLIAEMAAAAKEQDRTLYDQLERLYQRYGYAAEETIAITMAGKEGLEAIERTLQVLRAEPDRFQSLGVKRIQDYQTGEERSVPDGKTRRLAFPQSNVLLYQLDDLDWFCVRPSGTEPKLKLYFGCYDAQADRARERMAWLRDTVDKQIRSLLAGDLA